MPDGSCQLLVAPATPHSSPFGERLERPTRGSAAPRQTAGSGNRSCPVVPRTAAVPPAACAPAPAAAAHSVRPSAPSGERLHTRVAADGPRPAGPAIGPAGRSSSSADRVCSCNHLRRRDPTELVILIQAASHRCGWWQLVGKWCRRLLARARRRHAGKLLWMQHLAAGGRSHLVLGHELALVPDAERASTNAHLHDPPGQGCWAWQSIQHAVKGHEVVARDTPLFESKAFPGEATWQRPQPLVYPAVERARARGRVQTLVAPVTPLLRLPIKVIKVGKAHAWPETLLDDPDTALNLAFGLWRVGVADPSSHANGGQKIGKLGIPLGCLAVHLHEHAFHAVSENGGGQSLEILTRLHHATNKAGCVAAFGKGDKPHTRIAQHGGKAVEFVDLALLLEEKLAPVDLHLLAGLGFIAPYRLAGGPGRAERLDKGFEDADRAGVALSLEPFQHCLAVQQPVLHDPLTDLVLERVEFGCAAWPGCSLGCATQVLAHSVARDTGLSRNGPNGLTLCGEFAKSKHGLAPEHRPLPSGFSR